MWTLALGSVECGYGRCIIPVPPLWEGQKPLMKVLPEEPPGALFTDESRGSAWGSPWLLTDGIGLDALGVQVERSL